MKAKFIIGLGLLLGVVGVAQADTDFNGGALGTAGDWSNGLPGSGNPGTVDVNGALGNASQDNQLFSGATVTVGSGATLSGGVDFPAAGGNQWIINDATVNLTDDFFSKNSSFTLNAGSSVNAGDDFKAQSDGGNITINGGTHTAGDEFGSTPFTSTLDFLGGSVVAGRFQFNAGAITIGGTAVATATGTTLATDVDGTVNVLSDWSGWLTANSFSGSTWRDAVLAGTWTLDGTPIDGTLFDAEFIVSVDGKTLSIEALPEPDTTIFTNTAGYLGSTDSWSSGLPGPGNSGTVDVDGTLGNASQNQQLFSGATVTVGSNATLSGGIDFPAAGGNTWIFNDATVNLSDDFFSKDSSFTLNAGSSVNAGDDFKAQSDGGNITINGGTHTAGGQFGSTAFSSTLDFLGGNVVAGSFIFDVGQVTIGGTAVATDAGATTSTDVDGTVNVLSDWSGYLTAYSFTATTWRDAALAGTWTLDGTPIDGALFDANFVVSAGGKTLSLVVLPDPPAVAPAGLSAVSKPSYIDLTWNTSSESNVTGYLIYRGESPGTITDLLVGVVTNNYQDYAVVPGVTYYYAVAAHDIYGQESPASTASALAQSKVGLLAEDRFEYDGDGSSLVGKNGGTNWEGPWVWGGNASALFSQNGFDYPGLDTAGGSVVYPESHAAARSWGGSNFTTDGKAVWFSFLVNMGPDGDGGLGDELRVATFVDTPNTGDLGAVDATLLTVMNDGQVKIQGMGTDEVAAGVVETNQTYLLVGRVTFSDTPGSDVFNVWLNPEPWVEDPGTPLLSKTGDYNASGDYFSFRSTSGMQGAIDEVRIGDTYADVTPNEEIPPAVLTINIDGVGNVVFGASNLTTWATSTLQENDDLVYGTWSTLGTVTGVAQTNVVIPAEAPRNFYRVISNP